jgi:hypothetical protein
VYARTAAIQAKTAPIQTAIHRGMDHIRDTELPALGGVEGFLDWSLALDEEPGRCIFTTTWRSQEDMRANAESLRAIRDRAAEVFGGGTQIPVVDTQIPVEEWEIAVRLVAHFSGDLVRLTSFRVDPDQLDRAIDAYKMTTVPALKGGLAEGEEIFTYAILLVDRASGHALSAVSTSADFDRVRDNERSRDIVTAATTKAAGTGTEVLDAGVFQLKLGPPFVDLKEAEKV